jgi:hypothetical protein
MRRTMRRFPGGKNLRVIKKNRAAKRRPAFFDIAQQVRT